VPDLIVNVTSRTDQKHRDFIVRDATLTESSEQASQLPRGVFRAFENRTFLRRRPSDGSHRLGRTAPTQLPADRWAVPCFWNGVRFRARTNWLGALVPEGLETRRETWHPGHGVPTKKRDGAHVVGPVSTRVEDE